MKKQYRYKMDIRLDNVEKLIANQQDVEAVIGSLLDNYRFYNTILQWDDYKGKHKVHFDEIIILEEHLNTNMSKNVLYGIKYRGLREEEQKIIDLFDAMLEEQYQEEEAI